MLIVFFPLQFQGLQSRPDSGDIEILQWKLDKLAQSAKALGKAKEKVEEFCSDVKLNGSKDMLDSKTAAINDLDKLIKKIDTERNKMDKKLKKAETVPSPKKVGPTEMFFHPLYL